MKQLEFGMSGQDVVELKTWLNYLGLRDDKGQKLNVASNVFDVPCRQAVKRGQRKCKIEYDGKFGPQSQEMFKSLDPKNPKPIPKPRGKTPFHLVVEQHVRFTYNTFDEFFNGLGGKGYLWYNNDVYPQGEALDRLLKGLGLNCADIAQILNAVGEDLDKEMHYGHLKCQQGGHIVSIKGPIKNAKAENRIYDGAKKIDKNSGFTSPGDYWCKTTGYFISYDDPWLTGVDDGVT
ncbi:MAG: peptidoglycan-binding protein [Methanobacterium sp. ERen5]|nr:MAG: peptidoglycan-binding protein [Methanobacterium sp. ERen5]